MSRPWIIVAGTSILLLLVVVVTRPSFVLARRHVDNVAATTATATMLRSSHGEEGTIVLDVIDFDRDRDRRDDGHTPPSSALFREDHWYRFVPIVEEDAGGGGGEDFSSRRRTRWEVRRVPASGVMTQTDAAIATDAMTRQRRRRNRGGESPSFVEGDDDDDRPGDRLGDRLDDQDGEEEEGGGGGDFNNVVAHVLLSLLCVTCAAVAAGLTLGMLSLDPVFLEIKRRSSPPESVERKQSDLLLPMVVSHTRRHRLLVSLLLLNSLANEALPLFLDELLPNKYAAIIVSVTFVLFFGEIIPSALFTGPDQVRIAASLVPLAKAIVFVLSPIAAPIARLLDRVLHDGRGGEGGVDHVEGGDVTEGNYYNRHELSALVRIQYESQIAAKRRRKVKNESLLRKSIHAWEGGGNRNDDALDRIEHLESNERLGSRSTTIHRDEITMVEGALKLKTKFAADVCTPLNRVFALPSDTVLDEGVKVRLLAQGYSRVPVYHRRPHSEEEDVSGIIGVLLVRQLIVVDSSESRPISTMELRRPSCIPPGMHLVDIINLFQAGGGRGNGGLHLAIVCLQPGTASAALERGEPIPIEAGVVGIITLEDVVEELLQEEIYDEADRDLEFSRRAIRKWKAFVRRRKARRSREMRQATVSFAEEKTTEATPLLE